MRDRPSLPRPSLPRNVWVLGFVSLFMDLSSEIIHALLPLFITVTLGASVVVLGAIDTLLAVIWLAGATGPTNGLF